MAANLTIVPAPGRPKVLLCLCPAIRILNPNTEKLVARSFAVKSAVVLKCGDIRNSRLSPHIATRCTRSRNATCRCPGAILSTRRRSLCTHTHTHTHTPCCNSTPTDGRTLYRVSVGLVSSGCHRTMSVITQLMFSVCSCHIELCVYATRLRDRLKWEGQ